MTRYALLALIAVWLSGCASPNGGTGLPFLPLGGQSVADIQHPQVVEKFGGLYEDPALAAYVKRVGQRTVAASSSPSRTFTFTLLDSPVVNAFTIGDGYIYVTRGLLALMNDEAELAAVLAHEIAHNTAHHTTRQRVTNAITGIPAGILSIVPGTGLLVDLTRTTNQLLLGSFSRNDEYAADAIAVRTLAAAGYDPTAVTSMLENLQRDRALLADISGRDLEQQIPTWARTHPLTENRIERAEGRIAAVTALGPLQRNKQRYLQALDGMVFGDSPDAGVINGQHFTHPRLRLTFEAPSGFRMINTPQAVLMVNELGNFGVFKGTAWDADRSLQDYVKAATANALKKRNASVISSLSTVSQGLPVEQRVIRIGKGDGAVDLRLIAFRFSPDAVFQFSFINPASQSHLYGAFYNDTLASFRAISAEEAAAVEPKRLTITRVSANDSVSSLAELTPFASHQQPRFRVLNGLNEGSALSTGDQVKVIRQAPR